MSREEYSDPTSEAVDRIETSVDELEVLVQEIKDTDLANIEENIFSPLNYKPFQYNYISTSHPTGSWFEVLNIQGEGYFDYVIGCLNQLGGLMGVQITVDGVVQFQMDGQNDSTDNFHVLGVSLASNVMGGSINDASKLFRPYMMLTDSGRDIHIKPFIKALINGTLPFIANSGRNAMMLVPDKIGFATSLVVKFKAGASGPSYPVYGEFRGGVK